jgi:Fe2+ or Zn2+ uptake regulation protein
MWPFILECLQVRNLCKEGIPLESVERLVELFRDKGFKITHQRRVIFETLIGDGGHPTAEEIYQRVASQMPDISRTTVYNTLRELVSLHQLVAVEDLGEGGTHYDTEVSRHHHLFCMNCHTLKDLKRDFQGLDLAPAEAAGYRIVRSQVTFYGICPDCQRD